MYGAYIYEEYVNLLKLYYTYYIYIYVNLLRLYMSVLSVNELV